MGKGNEDLKAKIAKIQSKGKVSDVPAPVPEEEQEEGMEQLKAEFEAKKSALLQKAKTRPSPQPVPMEPEEHVEEGLEEAIQEYAEDGKFRVEIVFQLVQLNKSMKEIADTLKGLVNNDEE